MERYLLKNLGPGAAAQTVGKVDEIADLATKGEGMAIAPDLMTHPRDTEGVRSRMGLSRALTKLGMLIRQYAMVMGAEDVGPRDAHRALKAVWNAALEAESWMGRLPREGDAAGTAVLVQAGELAIELMWLLVGVLDAAGGPDGALAA
jgi:hypothetical protein